MVKFRARLGAGALLEKIGYAMTGIRALCSERIIYAIATLARSLSATERSCSSAASHAGRNLPPLYASMRNLRK